MKKLLVWDGDETLWNGTAIEGIDNVTLPTGRYNLCRELFERGVVQSVASYNTLADVETLLHKFGLDNFFLLPQAEFGGRNKAEMITTIKEQLNLSKYSDIVFVDDNIHNIAEVRTLLPDVVADTPDRLMMIVNQYFTKDEYTAEDKDRVRMYRSEINRQAMGQAFGGDKVAFLRSLGLRANITHPTPDQMPRVMQLIERANKLAAKNPIVKFDSDTLHTKLDSLYILTAVDNFGEYGISGVLLDDGAIDLLVISCRLQGKGLGSAFLGTIINKHVGQTLNAYWMETEYNAGIRALYDWYGFAITGFDVQATGVASLVHAKKQIGTKVDLPDWVEVTND